MYGAGVNVSRAYKCMYLYTGMEVVWMSPVQMYIFEVWMQVVLYHYTPYNNTVKPALKITCIEGPPVYKDHSGQVQEPLNQYCCTST